MDIKRPMKLRCSTRMLAISIDSSLLALINIEILESIDSTRIKQIELINNLTADSYKDFIAEENPILNDLIKKLNKSKL